MKAALKSEQGYNQMSVQEIASPQVKGDLVKIKVKFTGSAGLISILIKENMQTHDYL